MNSLISFLVILGCFIPVNSTAKNPLRGKIEFDLILIMECGCQCRSTNPIISFKKTKDPAQGELEHLKEIQLNDNGYLKVKLISEVLEFIVIKLPPECGSSLVKRQVTEENRSNPLIIFISNEGCSSSSLPIEPQLTRSNCLETVVNTRSDELRVRRSESTAGTLVRKINRGSSISYEPASATTRYNVFELINEREANIIYDTPWLKLCGVEEYVCGYYTDLDNRGTISRKKLIEITFKAEQNIPLYGDSNGVPNLSSRSGSIPIDDKFVPINSKIVDGVLYLMVERHNGQLIGWLECEVEENVTIIR